MKIHSLFLFFMIIFAKGYSQIRVSLDNFYNNEFNKTTGQSYHYLWNDTAITGFSELGKYFKQKNASLNILKTKPNFKNLINTDVFIIVDADTKDETQNPNYMDTSAAESIKNWVENGGVLLLLANNYKNAELDSFNILANKFGIQFSKKTLHYEVSEAGNKRNFNSCASIFLTNHPLFNSTSKIFLKEIAALEINESAKAVLVENNDVIIAESYYGKGYVLAIGDPWLYNEYIGHRILPNDFDNEQAAKNLVSLLINKVSKNN